MLQNAANQSRIPTLSLCGLRIFASRGGDRVTGRVEFPYSVYGRSTASIDYHSRRPGEPRSSARAAPSAPSAPSEPPSLRASVASSLGGSLPPCPVASLPSSLDPRARQRLDLVHQWRDLCTRNPAESRRALAEQVAVKAPIKCSVRSLQLWSQRLDSLGPDGLIDGYIPAPRKVLSLEGTLASDAVLVCAWWSFRIGNNDAIDTKMMHAAAALLCGTGFQPVPPSSLRGSVASSLGASSPSIPVADVLAVIDCYYAWPADRGRFPFKAFSKWVRYDFERWLFRALDENDYRATIARRRGDHRSVDPIPGVDRPVPLLDPPDGYHRERLRESIAASLTHCPPAKTRRRDAADRSTRQSIRALASPLGKGGSQGGIASALAAMDDNYRVVLLRAAGGDADAKRQAVSTQPIWWPLLPDDVRSDLERVTDIPLSCRKPGDDERIVRARVNLLLPQLKRKKGAGYERLGVAAGVI